MDYQNITEGGVESLIAMYNLLFSISDTTFKVSAAITLLIVLKGLAQAQQSVYVMKILNEVEVPTADDI